MYFGDFEESTPQQETIQPIEEPKKEEKKEGSRLIRGQLSPRTYIF